VIPYPLATDSVQARKQRLQADLVLVAVAAIWGSAFVVQRLVAVEAGIYLFNGLRFLLAALALAPLAASRRLTGREMAGLNRRTLPGVILVGLLLFSGAALQQAGLKYTTAGNAGFITGLYVVIIPVFLALFWRQRLRWITWLGAFLAVIGLFLLSTGGQFRLNRGDALELAGAVFWALHVIFTGRLVQRLDVLHFAVGQYLVCGLVSLGIGLVFEAQVLPSLAGYGWAVAYAGLISVGLGYTLQAVGQRVAPPADAAIILSLEAVFAALAGWFFLGEILSPVQLLGCAVMLAGMLLAQSEVIASSKAARQPPAGSEPVGGLDHAK
jgi:drug/metabolite transporter (DMT)-like permease